MEIEILGRPARSGYAKRIAFLHEAADPSKTAPASVRAELKKACRAAEFKGRDKETAGEGEWMLVGLGKAGGPFPKLRRTVKKTLREGLRHAKGRALVAFGEGVDAAAFQALLPQLAQSDYSYDRYKSRSRKRPGLRVLSLLPSTSAPASAWKPAVRAASVVAGAAAWARDLGNTPANDLGPTNATPRRLRRASFWCVQRSRCPA